MGRHASGDASLDNGQEEGHASGDAGYGPCLVMGTSWSRDLLGFQHFVTQRTSTKFGPKCAPCQRTLSCSRLWPNVAQNVPLVGGLCHTANFDQIWSKHVSFNGWLHFATGFDHIWIDHVLIIVNMPGLCKRIIIVNQRRTKTAVSDYNAMWSIR